jgi:hypothetical protein
MRPPGRTLLAAAAEDRNVDDDPLTVPRMAEIIYLTGDLMARRDGPPAAPGPQVAAAGRLRLGAPEYRDGKERHDSAGDAEDGECHDGLVPSGEVVQESA